MQQSNAPDKLVLPFAAAGAKNTIPVDSQVGITPGAASLEDGFPPLTRTPLSAGGVPPSGLDFNGIFYEMSNATRWANAGGGYPYDATFATDVNVGGYPKGARVLRSDASGYWLNLTDNNITDPEAGGAGWVPEYQYGISNIVMTSSNVTLTALEAGKPTIVITGLLTTNLNLIFPNYIKNWIVVNNTTGAFTITAKTAAGTGVEVTQGGVQSVFGDGVNIYSANPTVGTTIATPPQFDNDTSIVNSEFVQRALGGYLSYATAGQTIPASAANSKINLSGTASTITLPLASAMPAGSTLTFKSTVACTISRQSSDTIFANAANSALTSIAITDGGDLTFFNTGAGVWVVTGTDAISYSQSFYRSLGVSGWQVLPGGFIMQWGESTSVPNDGSTAVALPITFPTAAYIAQVSFRSGNITGLEGTESYNNLTTSSITLQNGTNASRDMTYFVIGK